jgi:hypothetical protein
MASDDETRVDLSGMTHDARRALQFVSRKKAALAAKRIRWPQTCALNVTVMGFRLWTIADDHMRMLTPEGYQAILVDVERTGAI